MHEHHRGRDGDRADDEQPAPRRVVDDQAGEDDAEAPADAEDGGDEPDRDTDLLGRELVADDPEAEWEDRASRALDRPRGDQHPDVPGECGDDRAEQEQGQADDEQPFFAVLIAELAEHRSRDRGNEQEHRQHPRDPGRRGVQFALKRRKRRNHHRLLERKCTAGQGQDRERDVVVLPTLGHIRSLRMTEPALRRAPVFGPL